jgi:hypothetical protein
MADKFSKQVVTLNAPVQTLITVTPSDTVDLTSPSRFVYVGVSGDLSITPIGNNSPVTLKNLSAGTFHFIRAKRIHATSTTATNIVIGL